MKVITEVEKKIEERCLFEFSSVLVSTEVLGTSLFLFVDFFGRSPAPQNN